MPCTAPRPRSLSRCRRMSWRPRCSTGHELASRAPRAGSQCGAQGCCQNDLCADCADVVTGRNASGRADGGARPLRAAGDAPPVERAVAAPGIAARSRSGARGERSRVARIELIQRVCLSSVTLWVPPLKIALGVEATHLYATARGFWSPVILCDRRPSRRSTRDLQRLPVCKSARGGAFVFFTGARTQRRVQAWRLIDYHAPLRHARHGLGPISSLE